MGEEKYSIKEIIRRLSRKPRFAGSLFANECAEYIKNIFREYGYNVETQNFSFMGWEMKRPPKVQFLNPEKVNVSALPVLWSGSTPENGIRGKLARAGTIITYEGYSWRKYAVEDENKKHLGYLITGPNDSWIQSLDDPSITMPYIMVEPETYKNIEKWMCSGDTVEVEIFVKTEFKPNLSFYNIIATPHNQKKEGRKIIVSAHYDSVINAPGANDNASGVAAVLELARIFSSLKNNVNLQFVIFGAHEFNKLGSRNFVRTLQETDQIGNINMNINFDLIGSGETILVCCDVKSVDEILCRKTRLWLRSLACDAVKELGIKNVEITSEGPRLDNWAFYKVGIPFIHFLCVPYKYLHTPEDTFDKIKPEMVKKVISIAKIIINGLLKD